MTFLSKIGALLLKGIAIVGPFLGVVQQSFPGSGGTVQIITRDLAQIAQIIAEVEAIGQLRNLPGADKARAAGPLVAQIILQSSLMTDKKIANPALFNQGCINIAGGLADVLNAIHPDGVKTHELT